MNKPCFVINLLIVYVTLTAISGSPLVAAKSGESVTVKDSICTDNLFGYSLQIPPEWKSKIGKGNSPDRVILQQKNARVPVKLSGSPELAQRPTIMIFADSCNLSADSFFTYLRAETGKSALKDKILSKSVFFERGAPSDADVIDKLPTQVAGRNGLRIRVRLEYTATAMARGTDTPSTVRDFRAGFVYVIPFDGWMMYIEEVGENQFLEALMEPFDSVIKSLKLNAAPAENRG